MPKTADPTRVQISARIRQDLREQLKAWQNEHGRTWEREVEAVIDYAFAHGYPNAPRP